jgi:hypothetical protein
MHLTLWRADEFNAFDSMPSRQIQCIWLCAEPTNSMHLTVCQADKFNAFDSDLLNSVLAIAYFSDAWQMGTTTHKLQARRLLPMLKRLQVR